MPQKVYSPCIEHLDPMACIGYSNIIVHCGINDIKNSGSNVEESVNRLIKKVEAIRSLCPNSKLTINPILPTKSEFLNARCRQFNKALFYYVDTQLDTKLKSLNFDVFLDNTSRVLKEDLGRYINKYDIIHIGSSGIKLLVNIVKERVCGSRVDGRAYGSVSSVNRESMNRGRAQNSGRVNGMRRVDRVSREGAVNMMKAPITTSDTPSSPQQQTQT